MIWFIIRCVKGLQALTRKEPVRESQLDTIFRLTVGKIVDPLSAEVIIVYFLDPENSAHLAHLFYSKSLFKNHPGLEDKFNRSLKSLSEDFRVVQQIEQFSQTVS